MKITPRSPADFQVAGHRSLMRLPTVPGSCGVQPPPHSHAFDIFFFYQFHSNSYHQPHPSRKKKNFQNPICYPKKNSSSLLWNFHRIGDAISQDLQALEAIWLHHITRRTTWSEFIEYDTLSQKPSSLGQGKNQREMIPRIIKKIMGLVKL